MCVGTSVAGIETTVSKEWRSSNQETRVYLRTEVAGLVHVQRGYETMKCLGAEVAGIVYLEYSYHIIKYVWTVVEGICGSKPLCLGAEVAGIVHVEWGYETLMCREWGSGD